MTARSTAGSTPWSVVRPATPATASPSRLTGWTAPANPPRDDVAEELAADRPAAGRGSVDGHAGGCEKRAQRCGDRDMVPLVDAREESPLGSIRIVASITPPPACRSTAKPAPATTASIRVIALEDLEHQALDAGCRGALGELLQQARTRRRSPATRPRPRTRPRPTWDRASGRSSRARRLARGRRRRASRSAPRDRRNRRRGTGRRGRLEGARPRGSARTCSRARAPRGRRPARRGRRRGRPEAQRAPVAQDDVALGALRRGAVTRPRRRRRSRPRRRARQPSRAGAGRSRAGCGGRPRSCRSRRARRRRRSHAQRFRRPRWNRPRCRWRRARPRLAEMAVAVVAVLVDVDQPDPGPSRCSTMARASARRADGVPS